MTWGVEIAALIALPVAGYIGAVALYRFANKDVARPWTDWNDDPRTAQLLNPWGSESLDPAISGGGDRARQGRGYADEGLHRTHSKGGL